MVKRAMYAVQELASRGEFFKFIELRPFEDKMVRCFARQICRGISYMKQKGFAHRDLKPENLVVDYKSNVKIIDWGFATRYSDQTGVGSLVNTPLGSEGYMAPEIRRGEQYDAHKADMFSIGVILFVLKVRGYPWSSAI